MTSDNNNPSSFPSKDRLGSKPISEENAIFQTFMNVIRNKFLTPAEDGNEDGKRRMRRLDEIYASSSYATEKNMLTRMNNNGMANGIAVGLISFAFLRAGPRIMNRVLARRYRNDHGGNGSGDSSGYQFDVNNSTGRSRPEIPRPGIFMRTVKFGLDVFLSLSLAAYGSAYFTDRGKLMQDLSKVPLVEGRSLLSDELCTDFIDIYRSIPKKTWDKFNGKSEPLDAIGGFVKNCLRRRVAEKELLAQRRTFGIASEDEHVEIPHPGVSRDIDVEIEWKDKSDDLTAERIVSKDDESFVSNDFDDGSSFETDFDSTEWNIEDNDDNDDFSRK